MVTKQDQKQVALYLKRRQQVGDYTLLPVNGTNFVDVFNEDEGWQGWSRVLVKPEFTRVVKGEKVHPKLLYRLFEGFRSVQ